jgi:oligopeptide transport system ATP-binding protein
MPLLQVQDLRVDIGPVSILRGVSLSLEPGETLGVVGESGCGKSMTGLTLMGMLPPTGRIVSGSATLEGRALERLTDRDWRALRGKEIAMVMQDPFTSLNPMMRVGDQIAEVYRLHQGLGKEAANAKAVEMIEKVGVPDPATSARKFPHQLSGGQRQRIVIGIAFAAKPKVLIADEPTTALDVTLQAQILRLLRDLQQEEGTGVILITHDIGVIAAMARRVAVFYAGQVVEMGTVEQVLRRPAHPYTQALLDSLPDHRLDRLKIIQGQPPSLASLPPGCPFVPRCPLRHPACESSPPLREKEAGHSASCWLIE